MRRRELLKFLGNAAIAWPFVAHAQSKVYRVGLLTLEAGDDASQLVGKLRDLGYVEGKNLYYEYRSAEGDPKRLDEQPETVSAQAALGFSGLRGLHNIRHRSARF
jgi:putative tryptophan/tyrosine transport system substrate-binding protein